MRSERFVWSEGDVTVTQAFPTDNKERALEVRAARKAAGTWSVVHEELFTKVYG